MNKVTKYICFGLIVVCAVISYFSTIPLVDYLAYAVEMATAGVLCSKTLEKATKKTWKEYVAIIGIGLGSFGLGFVGVAPDTVSQIISLIVSVLLLIAGVFLTKKAE